MTSEKGENALLAARAAAERETEDAKERNRLWWERLPMTYVDWERANRVPTSLDQYAAMEKTLLAASPFLREHFDFAALKGQEVLDLGCGAGVLSALLAKNGARVTAADITDQGVRLTRRNARTQGLDIKVVRTDAENLRLGDATFDYVLSWGVLHHVPQTERALGEVARVLKPRGRGLIMVYHKRSLFYYLKGIIWLVFKGKIFKGHTLKTVQDFYVDGYYHRHFTKAELARSLRGAGLEPEETFATQQQQKILPFVPAPLDRFLKRRLGWYLVARFSKP